MTTLNNTYEHFASVNISYAIFVPILIFVITFANILIIAGFVKIPSLRAERPSEVLILNLAIVDLLTGLELSFASPSYVLFDMWPSGELGCRLGSGVFYICIHTSLATLVAISVDRFLLVYNEYPTYLLIQSKYRVRMTIAVCWAVGICSFVVEQSVWNYSKTINENARNIDFNRVCLVPPRRIYSYSLIVFLLLYITPTMVVTLSSIAFIHTLRKRLRSINAVQAVPRSTLRRQSHRYTKPAVSLVALVVSMIVCMFPYSFYVIIVNMFCSECGNPDILYGFVFLQYINAGLDPILYGITHRKIRKYYIRLFITR